MPGVKGRRADPRVDKNEQKCDRPSFKDVLQFTGYEERGGGRREGRGEGTEGRAERERVDGTKGKGGQNGAEKGWRKEGRGWRVGESFNRFRSSHLSEIYGSNDASRN